jgi:hypothetical protein
MAEFTLHVTRHDGQITQIGDNDSGRLFKLHPSYTKMTAADAKRNYTQLANYDALPDDALYWDENVLDHRHLVAAVNGLFGREDLRAWSGECLDEMIVRGMGKEIEPPRRQERQDYLFKENLENIGTAQKTGRLQAEKVRIGEHLPSVTGNTIHLTFEGESLRAGLKCYGYPDFGLYIFRSKRLYMTVRCGSVGQRGNGGHAHSDQLSIELLVDGKPYLQDPGTYLYTPLPERRNQYRSMEAHATPQLERESADLSILFRMPDTFQAQVLYFGEAGFVGTMQANAQTITRRIAIDDDRIEIMDSGSTDFKPQGVLMSNGYGKQLANEPSVNLKS